jgi:hypothetical protein
MPGIHRDLSGDSGNFSDDELLSILNQLGVQPRSSARHEERGMYLFSENRDSVARERPASAASASILARPSVPAKRQASLYEDLLQCQHDIGRAASNPEQQLLSSWAESRPSTSTRVRDRPGRFVSDSRQSPLTVNSTKANKGSFRHPIPRDYFRRSDSSSNDNSSGSVAPTNWESTYKTKELSEVTSSSDLSNCSSLHKNSDPEDFSFRRSAYISECLSRVGEPSVLEGNFHERGDAVNDEVRAQQHILCKIQEEQERKMLELALAQSAADVVITTSQCHSRHTCNLNQRSEAMTQRPVSSIDLSFEQDQLELVLKLSEQESSVKHCNAGFQISEGEECLPQLVTPASGIVVSSSKTVDTEEEEQHMMQLALTLSKQEYQASYPTKPYQRVAFLPRELSLRDSTSGLLLDKLTTEETTINTNHHKDWSESAADTWKQSQSLALAEFKTMVGSTAFKDTIALANYQVDDDSERTEMLRRGQLETIGAIRTGRAHVIECHGCNERLQAPIHYSLVYCISCGVVSPGKTAKFIWRREE